MLNDLKIKVGPQVYRYAKDAIDFVPKMFEEFNAKKILVVHGTISWEKAKKFIHFLDDERFEFYYHQYTGECSYYGVDLIKQKVDENNIDFILGVGGGKLSDLVGLSGHMLNLPYGVIPTLASNCAPWTPLSVMYKESGESEGKSEHYLRQAAFLITDPYLVIDSPIEYFIAGLADTLAKWYESDMILSQKHLVKEPFLMLARYTALISKDILLEEGDKAIADMKSGVVSDEFVHCSEIIIAVAGMVGGLGDKYARNAAAHALHDGISKYLPHSHAYLHGEKVAYGIFYQLAIEDKWDVIDSLLPLYEKLHLPRCLTDMELYPLDGELLDKIAAFVDSKEKVHLIPLEINQQVLRSKIIELEKYILEK